MTLEKIVTRLRDAKTELSERFLVKELAVFGSYARGDSRADSDVDILVNVDPAIGLGFVSLADRLEELLGLPVDLISTRAVKPRMKTEIERDLVNV